MLVNVQYRCGRSRVLYANRIAREHKLFFACIQYSRSRDAVLQRATRHETDDSMVYIHLTCRFATSDAEQQ